jgi:hypothetical protein
MDANTGAKLFSSLWPKIDVALSEENRADRLRFISALLQCFAANGAELSQIMNIDEDVRSCAQHLGTQTTKPKRRTGTFVFDTTGLGDPVDYELVGGPFDGATIRLGAGLSEMPPGLVTLAADGHTTRMDADAAYKLSQVTERDTDGNPTCEYLAYKHVPQNAK